jgi:Response regulator containing a CheY-like receiver domain and an HTH DNA-binding domain
MISGKLRVVGFCLLVAISIGLSIESAGPARTIFDAIACALLVLGFLLLTRADKARSWRDALVLYLSLLCVLWLMLTDERPMFAGLLLFIVVPAGSGLPLAHRIASYIATYAIIASLYIARGLYYSLDPIVPIFQFIGISSLVAFTEILRKQRESTEEGRRLLEELIGAQRKIAEAESDARSKTERAAIRKSLGGLLAKAALQVEAAKELWPRDQGQAEHIAQTAAETIRAAIEALRDTDAIVDALPLDRPSRLIIAHESAELRASLSIVLRLEGESVVEACASNEAELVAACEERDCDAVIVDEDLPPEGGLAALRALAKAKPGIRRVLMSALPDPALDARAREEGALGLIEYGGSPDDMRAAVRGALLGAVRGASPTVSRDYGAAALAESAARPQLSQRELQILALIAKGFSNKEIADRLYLAEGTVKNKVSAILQKIGARDRGNAALKARELGLI